MSERKLLAKNTIIIMLIGISYYIFIRLTGLSIPCPVHLVTKGKILCPGCGTTKMCLKIIKGDFGAAFRENQCVFVLLIFWAIIITLKLIFDPDKLKSNSTLMKIFMYTSIAALLIFGIVRNIILIKG